MEPPLTVLNKDLVKAFLSEIDPESALDDDSLELLNALSSEVVISVMDLASKFALHRESAQVESRDVQLALEKLYNIKLAGFQAELQVQVAKGKK